MKSITPKQVILVLVTTALMLCGILFLPFHPPLIKLPKYNEFVQESVEQVKTIHGLNAEISFVEVPLNAPLDSNDDQSLGWYAVKAHEKINHSSDFTNDLKSFHEQLNLLMTGDTSVRVLHFGDSQIEGDRVSGQLRQEFQNVFGGCGTGFIPISENGVYRLNINKTVSGWQRKKVFGGKTNSKHNRYGFLGYYHHTDPKKENSYIQLRKKKKYFEGVKKAEKLSLLYRIEGDDQPLMQLVSSKKKVNPYQWISAGPVRKSTWKIDSFPVQSLNLQFNMDTTTQLYGLSLDCKHGIAVDNIGMRGSSGTEFTKMDESNLKHQLSLLNVGLVIYQFGVNVIPFVVEDYKFYEDLVYAQLKRLKKVMPNVPILVVGVSDMCQKKEGDFKSFPNIANVIKAQKNAAKKAGCPFWDLQQVMGGEGAMKKWVNANPPLGEKDYTHFNRRGANLVGKKLFQALMHDFTIFNQFQKGI